MSALGQRGAIQVDNINVHKHKPPTPFNISAQCLYDEDYVQRVKNAWRPYNLVYPSCATVQFLNNLKMIKSMTVEWEDDQRKSQEA